MDISTYRTSLSDYLKSRMMAVAPNVTVLLGDLVGARILAQGGNYKLFKLLICFVKHFLCYAYRIIS